MTGCSESDDEVTAPMRGATVARPAAEGTVTGGAGMPFVASTMFDLGQVGYRADEYFIAGTASAYVNNGPLTPNGLWSVSPGTTAAYKTRIIVYRPIEARDFNGSVVVEWLNVSGGLDAAPDWIAGHVQLIREGFAYVGVSAQYVGVEGGNSIVGLTPMPLKEVDPARYGSLSHPGDSFSYDIFSQAAQLVRRPGDLDPLAGLDVERVIAIGESQSAFRLVTYINGIHPLADIYDGFLVHSRSAGGTALAEMPLTPIPVAGPTVIRSDLNVPVFTLQMETDMTILGFAPARQPDSDRFRLWEVAGTAHADTYTVVGGSNDLGDSPEVAKIVVTAEPIPGIISCPLPINSGPQHFLVNAAFSALNEWIRSGTPPAIAPRLDIDFGPPLRIRRDEDGIALGGIRTSYVDAPIATLSGEGQTGSILCILFGTTTPFSADKLTSLYPDHPAYVAAVQASTDAAVAAGFLVPADAALINAAAEDTPVDGAAASTP